VFDTMVAAQVLGYPRCGLAALLSEFFGVTLEKRYQTSDWRARPLTEGQIDYAYRDTHYLLALRERLGAEMIQVGRQEEAESEFRRVAAVVLEQRPFDPIGFTRLRQARLLDPLELSRLKELYLARNAIAERSDRAPYRILDDSTLIELARRAPRDHQQLGQMRGLRAWKVERFGDQVLAALHRAETSGPMSWPRRGRASPRPPELTPAEKSLLHALRRWRDDRARDRGVEPARVATTAMLTRIAVAKPGHVEALGELPGMDAWRVREYGEEILALVRQGLVEQ
jgi:ribonuclease D